MILYSTPTSPFGRKVKIAARAHGLIERIRIETADPWSEDDQLRRVNPLGKMPALVTPEGEAIYGSGVIFDYFDTLLDKPRLYPKERNIAMRTMHALGDGLIEAGLIITYEKLRRPDAFRYDPWINHQLGKIMRGLEAMVATPPDPMSADAGSITLACALGYFGWRKQIDWRAQYPALIDWLDTFRASFPAFDETAMEH